MWRPVLEALSDQIHAVVPDLPGHGAHSGRPYVSHDRAVDELVDLLRETTQKSAIVVGFSLGAQLAIRLAADRRAHVDEVVVVSAETRPAPLPAFTLWMLGVAAPLARRAWFARAQARQLRVPDELFEHYLRDSRQISRETLRASIGDNMHFTLPAGWSSFDGAATVIVGEKERTLMRESAQHTHEALPGSTLMVVPGASHDIPFTRPDVIADAVRDAVAHKA